MRNLGVEMALRHRAAGQRLAIFRERAHLTQAEAAQRVGVSLRAYQKWEAGGGIQHANIRKIADVLATTPEEITGEVETPDPFRISEQLDDVIAHFEQRVNVVEALLRERNEYFVQQLAEQRMLLEEIRGLLAQSREVMQPDHLAQYVTEESARIRRAERSKRPG